MKEGALWKTVDFPGGKKSLRVLAALDLYKQKKCLIISSGGRGKLPAGAPLVCEVIKSEFIASGVPAQDIILEACSYDTLDQLLEIRRILLKYKPESATIISNQWHLPRVKAMMEVHPLLNQIKSVKFLSAEEIIHQTELENIPQEELDGEKQVREGNYNYGFNVCGRKVGQGSPVFVVAEISGNHYQNYDEAVKLVKAAAEAGADAVKFQTYTPDTMTINSNKQWFRVGGEDNPENWQGKTLYQLYQENYTPWGWLPKLKKLVEDLGLVFFSTPFDETAVDFLEGLGTPCYKIASYEITDIPLLKKVGETGKPVIISVGFVDLREIELAVETLKQSGAFKIALLHCLTNYSEGVQKEQAYLGTIADLAERFKLISGFSDNNAGIEVPVAAVESGACIIEKHLILDRKLGGADAGFSLEPREFKEMVRKIRLLTPTLSSQRRGRKGEEGRIHYGPANAQEEYNKRFRRSIFAVKDIKNGEKLTRDNIRVIRPAFGLEPKYYQEVLGKTARLNIEKGTPLSWELLDWQNLRM